MYSYDRTKVASFQDQFKGSFDCVVRINDFTIEKNKTITVSGMVALYLDGDTGVDIPFSDVTLKKKGKKWSVVQAPQAIESTLNMLLSKDGKTSKELDRLQKMT